MRIERGPQRRFILLVQTAISLGLIAVLLLRAHWDELRLSGSRISPLFVGLAVLSFGVIAALEVGRLRVVLGHLRLSWVKLWRLHAIGAFFASFLPGQLGADFYKVAALRTTEGGVTRLATLILTLRLYGLVVLVSGAVVAVWWIEPSPSRMPRIEPLEAWLERMEPALWLGLAGILLFALLGLARIGRHWKVLARFCTVAGEVRRALAMIRPALTVRILLLSVLILGARTLLFYSLVAAFGIRLPPSVALLVVTLATLMTLLPISFAGIGVREGLVVVLLSQFSVGYEDAVLVALSGRALILAFSIAGGLWLLAETLRPRPISEPHRLER